jgi:tRNA-binding protein
MSSAARSTITVDQFLAVDIRIGTVIAVEPFPEARKPALKLTIDFGQVVGKKRSSAQVTDHYCAENLLGRQVVAAVNLPPKRIGAFLSEVLVLGFSDNAGAVVLCIPDRPVPDGGRMY